MGGFPPSPRLGVGTPGFISHFWPVLSLPPLAPAGGNARSGVAAPPPCSPAPATPKALGPVGAAHASPLCREQKSGEEEEEEEEQQEKKPDPLHQLILHFSRTALTEKRWVRRWGGHGPEGQPLPAGPRSRGQDSWVVSQLREERGLVGSSGEVGLGVLLPVPKRVGAVSPDARVL